MLRLVQLVNYKFSYISKLCRTLTLLFLLDPLNIYVKSNLKHFIQHQYCYCSKAVYGCKRDRIYYYSSFLLEPIGQNNIWDISSPL